MIPPETIVPIVRAAAQACWTLQGQRDKKQFATLSLVCRYWSQIIRPALFSRLILRDGQDLDDLLLLLLSPTVHIEPPLTQCIREIVVTQSGSLRAPWFHRVLNVQQNATQQLEFHLGVRGWKDVGPNGILSASLPRTLPSSIFPFTELALSGVHFQRVNDLIRTIRDLSELCILYCRELSFGDTSMLQRGVPPRRRSDPEDLSRNFSVSAKDCGGQKMDKELMFLLVSRMVRRRHSLTPLGEDIWQASKMLIMAIKAENTFIPNLEGEDLAMVLYRVCTRAHRTTHSLRLVYYLSTARHLRSPAKKNPWLHHHHHA